MPEFFGIARNLASFYNLKRTIHVVRKALLIVFLFWVNNQIYMSSIFSNCNIYMLLLVCFLSSCAGPTSPFGKVEPQFIKKVHSKIDLSHLDSSSSRKVAQKIQLAPQNIDQIRIKISPDRQRIHAKSHLKIAIYDPEGLSSSFELKIFYDGNDVTDSFVKNSIVERNKENNKITYGLQNFRLIPINTNKIIIGYRRNLISPIVYTEYKKPTCDLRSDEDIENFTLFRNKRKTMSTLRKVAAHKTINPNFLAGLVAQESSFNPNAVSYAKAVGLTQITPIAEKHVVERYPYFPKHKSANKIPVPLLKSLIVAGSINSKNEWRLNEEYSLIGGAEYLEYIENYWNKEENNWILKKIFGDEKKVINDVILASYNSGSFRVKQSIRKKGKEWLKVKELTEANLYVKRVKSYCHHFAKKDEERI